LPFSQFDGPSPHQGSINPALCHGKLTKILSRLSARSPFS
jgi:hypothetical protein